MSVWFEVDGLSVGNSDGRVLQERDSDKSVGDSGLELRRRLSNDKGRGPEAQRLRETKRRLRRKRLVYTGDWQARKVREVSAGQVGRSEARPEGDGAWVRMRTWLWMWE